MSVREPLPPQSPFEIVRSPLQKNRFLPILLWILTATTITAVLYAPWRSDTVFHIKRLLPEWNVVLYNCKLLLKGQGGYAQTLWGWLIFLSMSGWFYAVGKFALFKILPQSEISEGEAHGARWILGSGVVGFAWFTMGLAGLFTPTAALIWTASGLTLAAFLLFRAARSADWSELKNWRPDLVSASAMVLGLWVLSWSALAGFPQFFWDTLSVNLALPGFYAAEGKLIHNPFNLYSYFPQNSELLLTWPILLNSTQAAYLLVWGFFCATLLFLYGWISRAASKFAALCGISLFVSSYLGPWLGTYVKNDLQTASFLLLHWWALFHALRLYQRQTPEWPRWLFLSGIAAGIACGHKLSALHPVAASCAGLILFIFFTPPVPSSNTFKTACKAALLLGAGLFLAWTPWVARSWAYTGDPLYPFLTKILHLQPLHDWHRPLPIYPVEYTLSHSGWQGLVDYFHNLLQFKPRGFFGNTTIWWGPGGWLGLIGLACLSAVFVSEMRWIAGIVTVGWFFSLQAALISRYHAASLIFVLTVCCALALDTAIQASKFKALKWAVALAVLLDFMRGASLQLSQRTLTSSLFAMATGSQTYHYIPSLSGGTNDAQADEVEWVNALINRHAPVQDRVLFVGTSRAAGMRRKHLAGMYWDKQPVLYYAEQSKDAADLRDKLLALGIRHIVYEPSSWTTWTKDGMGGHPHHIQVQGADIAKVGELLSTHSQIRFSTLSGKLHWFTLRKEGEAFPSPPIDAWDVYRLPHRYLQIADAQSKNRQFEDAVRLLQLLDRHTFPAVLQIQIKNMLGSCHAYAGRLEQAMNYFNQIINESPRYLRNDTNFSGALANRAAVCQALGKLDDAARDFSAAIALNPKNPKFYAARAKIYAAQGNQLGAQSDLNKVNELNDAR